jgi:hypothetical protein
LVLLCFVGGLRQQGRKFLSLPGASLTLFGPADARDILLVLPARNGRVQKKLLQRQKLFLCNYLLRPFSPG